MNPVTLALATARLTSLIAEDEITAPIRKRVDEWANGHPEGSLRERLNYLVTCSRCVSVYAGGAVLAASLVPPLRPLLRTLAASQAGLVILTLSDRLEVGS